MVWFAPLIVSVACAATHRLHYTFEVTFGASDYGLNVGDEIEGWFDYDATTLDQNPGSTVGAFTDAIVDYGFTSHAFVTPAIDWSVILVDNNRFMSGQYWAGHVLSFQTVGGPGPHLKKVDLSALHSGVSLFGFMTSDAIPTVGADIELSNQYGSTLRFENSGLETPVDGRMTAVSIQALAVPDGGSTLALLGLAAAGAVAMRIRRTLAAR